LDEFYQGFMTYDIAPDEMVSEIYVLRLLERRHIPSLGGGTPIRLPS
jgi:hypothetical protein